MLLNFDDFRDQLSDVLFYTWDPEQRQHDHSANRHCYFHLTEDLAAGIIEDRSLQNIRRLLELLRKRYWPQQPILPGQEQAAQTIMQLINQSEFELS